MSTEQKYMYRCLELAALGLGNVAPNPMVGCVVVHNGKIIGEGYHQKCGEPHAEVNAIRSVKDKKLLQKSSLYVTLEPCAHHGKTPPCSDLIIAKRIPRVVVGTIDPFTKVAGKGIEKMRKAGVEVTIGVLEKKCREQNRRFFTFHEKKRPYVILKWAQTLDGFIDKKENVPAWITNDLSRQLVHKQRTEENAILIGTNTAEKDNPSLTVREWKGNQPFRMVLDRTDCLSPDLQLFDGTASTIIFTDIKTKNFKKEKSRVEYVKIDFSRDVLFQLLDYLYKNNIQSVIIEGGTKLLTSVIETKLWDEAYVYTGNHFFGQGVKAPPISGKIMAIERLDECQLSVIRNS